MSGNRYLDNEFGILFKGKSFYFDLFNMIFACQWNHSFKLYSYQWKNQSQLTETGFFIPSYKISTWSLSLPQNSTFSAPNFKECKKIKGFIWSHTKPLENKGFLDNLCSENGLIWSYCVQSGHTDCSITRFIILSDFSCFSIYKVPLIFWSIRIYSICNFI